MLLFYFRYNNIIIYLCHTITFYKLKIKNGLYPDKVGWDIVLARCVILDELLLITVLYYETFVSRTSFCRR